jgi:hypothetical protein
MVGRPALPTLRFPEVQGSRALLLVPPTLAEAQERLARSVLVGMLSFLATATLAVCPVAVEAGPSRRPQITARSPAVLAVPVLSSLTFTRSRDDCSHCRWCCSQHFGAS